MLLSYRLYNQMSGCGVSIAAHLYIKVNILAELMIYADSRQLNRK